MFLGIVCCCSNCVYMPSKYQLCFATRSHDCFVEHTVLPRFLSSYNWKSFAKFSHQFLWQISTTLQVLISATLNTWNKRNNVSATERQQFKTRKDACGQKKYLDLGWFVVYVGWLQVKIQRVPSHNISATQLHMQPCQVIKCKRGNDYLFWSGAIHIHFSS